MNLTVVLPSKQLLNEEVTRIVAEGPEGVFCLLPKHIDYVTSLVPGLVIYETPDGNEKYLGVDRGTLTKVGQRVTISISNAVRGTELGELRNAIREKFVRIDESERQERSALASLEANFIQRLMELRDRE